MRIEVRVSSVEILPNDASGVRLIAEVCDASEFVESILRRPDDGVDSWALGSRYQEVCDENRRLRSARQPAPETPTPRIEVLAEKVASALFTDYNGLLVDRLVLTYDGPRREMGGLCYNAVRDTVAQILRQHAATLKERKEKADG